ncbi:MAG: ABC transporter ATP-binding protein [Aestuariivita sp.]|nr:ABC transporter ATP-binding protein [Aestuariivita sp.]
MSKLILIAKDLYREYYGVQALTGASLQVEEGTITGLIGPNGAGKTTMFNCLTGVVPAEKGTIVFNGTNVTGWRPERICSIGMVRTFQIARGFPSLTVLETLLLHGDRQPGESVIRSLVSQKSWTAREQELEARAHKIATRLKLDHLLSNMSSDLSGGQKKLLEIGRALMGNPKLVLLDEPAAGVNPTLVGEIAERILELRGSGINFLVIDHDLELIARICNVVTVMAHGTHLTTGSYEEVTSDPRVQDAYLGLAA